MSTKEKVIEILESKKGEYVSGEALANKCNVSRNAIWKNITELRKNGYPIKSVTNRGYMLEKDSDIISKAGICMYIEKLKGKGVATNVEPEAISVYDEIDSTNNEAKRNLIFNNDHLVHGTVIIAKRQTAGRGHGGSEFSSPEGGIYVSILLEPETYEGSGRVTEVIRRATCRVLEKCFATNLKWKKDSSLYLGDEKVCGIMTEGISDLETGIYSNYIAGIGIRAGKLEELLDIHPQKNEIIANIIAEIV